MDTSAAKKNLESTTRRIMMMKKGIDVSRWQGDIDWTKVREAGIEFVIIKAGGSDDGFYTDSKFEKNYKGAKEAGISVGAYYIVGSKCVSRIDGVSDANRFINIIKGKQFDYPVYIDLELTSPADKCGANSAQRSVSRASQRKCLY